MKISRLILAGIITTLLFAGCNKEEGMFSVSGKITHAEGQIIYLEELQVA